MLIIPPSNYVKSSRRVTRKKSAAALVLTAAAYDVSGPLVLLTFDRDIDIDAIDVGQFQVSDGELTMRRYLGTGAAEILGPQLVRVMLAEQAVITAGNVSMTVLAENGIIAVDDGGTWEGVNDLSLPFEAP
jgi:hypothetical protein